MKKILTVLVLLVLNTFILAACSSAQQSAYDYYTKMNLAMESVKSLQGKANYKVDMQNGGENIGVNMSMDMKQIMRSETDVEMAMVTSVDMGEMGKQDVTIYFKDGWLYQEMMGMKMKMALPLEEIMKMTNADTLAPFEFYESAITASEVTETPDGARLSFTLSGSELSDKLGEMVSPMLSTLGIEEDIDMTFGDMSYEILLGSDDMPKEMRIVYSVDMEVEGEKVSASYDIDMTDLAYNSVSEIEYPADLDSYMEVAV